ncbi:Uncharacterized protein HZ326_0572 [Fusarium oxysporum f. sp. albedinis]|nr:Uncharacterized protein HZ326_0572 [Fusarium oxysporum f. sp. albedinis]
MLPTHCASASIWHFPLSRKNDRRSFNVLLRNLALLSWPGAACLGDVSQRVSALLVLGAPIKVWRQAQPDAGTAGGSVRVTCTSLMGLSLVRPSHPTITKRRLRSGSAIAIARPWSWPRVRVRASVGCRS